MVLIKKSFLFNNKSNIPLIVYVHIEKCAGTTLNFIMGNNFPFFLYPRPRNFTNSTNTIFQLKYLRKALKLFPFVQGVSGHNIRPFAEYEKATNRDILQFTFLRDPIARYMSHLNYQRVVMNINWKLNEFLENSGMRNFQTVKIAGKEDLNLAKKIIGKHMHFIGFTEYFDQSLLLLEREYGVNLNLYYKKRNILKNDTSKPILRFSELSSNEKEHILNNNKLDIELYNYYLEKFKYQFKLKFHTTLEDTSLKKLMKKRRIVIKFYTSIIFKRFYRKILEPLFFKGYLLSVQKIPHSNN